MGKKGRNKQQKTTRKKNHHIHDDSLPFIEVTPNLENKPVPYIPTVIFDCDKKVSPRVIKKIQKRLLFADPHDLRYLSCVRIVEPSAIKLPSKETTDGCYWPEWKERKPEIWLSANLFRSPGIKWMLLNFFILRKDRLFETLFHELGHHKAHHIRLVSSYKQEAYAEKYMQAYKDAWYKHHGSIRSVQKLSNRVLSLLMNRYVMFVFCFLMRKRNPGMQKMYNLYKQYVFRRITKEELSQYMDAMVDHTASRKKSQKTKKWTHPLRKQEYRDKFRLDE
ncbi:hypothetical protein U27_00049 [Candidatus Vecturithrix granuli]|uniref:Uncharacterized protein n=1 Tax=Vecturithrix granuli TaxID=1499967 RepID=A0A081C6F3_VECG1|nr:hypothetical protein U27_00049 [Candidatus Vecturithrix granuli]